MILRFDTWSLRFSYTCRDVYRPRGRKALLSSSPYLSVDAGTGAARRLSRTRRRCWLVRPSGGRCYK